MLHHQKGTLLIGYFDNDKLIVGIDSLVRNVYAGTQEIAIKVCGPVKGFYITLAGDCWVDEGINKIYQCFNEAFDDNLDETPTDRIAVFESKLNDYATQLEDHSATSLLEGKEPLNLIKTMTNTIVFGSYQEKLFAWTHTLIFTDEGSKVSHKISACDIYSTPFPPEGGWAMFGKIAKAKEIHQSKKERIKMQGPFRLIAEMLVAQTGHTPDSVGEPYRIVTVEVGQNPKIDVLTITQIKSFDAV